MTSLRHRQLRQWLGSRCLYFAWSSALGAAAAASSPLHSHLEDISPTIPWFLGLVGHWQWAFLIIGLSGAALALTARRWSAAAAAGLILFSWSFQISATPVTGEVKARPVQVLTVSTVNLNYDNQNIVPLLKWLDSSESPDIVVLQEFTAAHQQALGGTKGNQVLKAYTHRALHPQPDQFGLGVLSKWPLDEIEVVQPIEATQTLKLRLKVKWQGLPVLLTAVHPMPPISPVYAKVRDDSLRLEMHRLAQLGISGILAGDFNDTPWSAGMRALEPTLSRASGLQPTWPNANGFLSLLPLDHILVTRHWQRSTYALGPDVGSDHRPVIATLVAAP